MSIASKLQDVADCKSAIKDAIEAKGVTVGYAALSEYANKISQIQTGGQTVNYVYPLVKVLEENWASTTKEDDTLYAII
jgi:hypothetical protein